jgi:hypothetical protein
MSRYTVIWWPPTLADLATLWMSYPNRQAIRIAADSIDQILAENPSTKGDEVREGLRRLVVPPLKVQFVVEDVDMQVRVLTVRV